MDNIFTPEAKYGHHFITWRQTPKHHSHAVIPIYIRWTGNMGYDDLSIDLATEPDRDQKINNLNKCVMDRAEKNEPCGPQLHPQKSLLCISVSACSSTAEWQVRQSWVKSQGRAGHGRIVYSGFWQQQLQEITHGAVVWPCSLPASQETRCTLFALPFLLPMPVIIQAPTHTHTNFSTNSSAGQALNSVTPPWIILSYSV